MDAQPALDSRRDATASSGSVERLVRPFRVCTDEVWENGFYGRYRDHQIAIERDYPRDDWYILVTTRSGLRAYDGWWRDSAHKPVREAIEQALRGAMLWPNTEVSD